MADVTKPQSVNVTEYGGPDTSPTTTTKTTSKEYNPSAPMSQSEAVARGMGAGLTLNQLPRAIAAGAAGSVDEEEQPAVYVHPSQIISGAVRMGLEKLAPQYFGDSASKAYEQGVAQELQRQKDIREEYPTTYNLSNIVGATINPVNRLIPAPQGGAGFLQNARSAAVPSAVIGGIEGSGEGDTLAERGQNAIYGAIGGGTVGGLVGGTVGQFVPKPSSILPAAAPTALEVAQAAERQGIEVPKVVASTSPGLITAASTATKIPLVGGPLERAAQATTSQIGQKIEDLAAGESRASAGAEAKAALENWIGKGSTDLVNQGYDAVDKLITNPQALTDLSKTRSIAQSIQDELTAANIEGMDPAVLQVLNAATNPEGLTYNGIKTLRTTIGNALDNPTDVMKSAQPSLRRLYGALSSDLQDAVENSGGKAAVKAFNEASDLASNVAATREALQKITGVSSTANSGEAIFNRLLSYADAGKSGDVSRLKLAQYVTPADVWDKISQGAVDTLSRDANNQSNINTFFKNYGKLSNEGKDILFGSSTSNPGMRTALDDLSTIGSRIDRLNAISAKTGDKTKGGIGLGEAIALFNAPGTTTSGILGGRSFSNIMASPVTTESVQKWATNYERFLRSPSQATANALGAATKATATMVGGEYGVPSADTVINGIIAGSQGIKAANYLYNWYKGDLEERDKSNTFANPRQGDIFAGQQADGGRVGRASGGSVIDKKADALINETMRNKNLNSQHTEHLLSMPDDAIVQALKVAKQVAA